MKKELILKSLEEKKRRYSSFLEFQQLYLEICLFVY